MAIARLLACVALMVGCGGGASSSEANTGTPSDDGGGEQDTKGADGAHDGAAIDTAGGDDASSDTGPTTCSFRPKCDTPLPDVGPKRGWRHTTSSITASVGSPRHRGRDLFLPNKSGPQWAIGKFAYGTVDKDIKDEDVDVWLLRDCGSKWKKIGTYPTTSDGMHATEEGVDDSGGRVYVDIAKDDAPLGVGRHRLHFVVAGDLSSADAYIEVLPDGSQIVVTDVDGTLTTSETAAWSELYGAAPPDANPGAPEALTALAKKGFYIFYLTARPEWFMEKTRDWVTIRNFPAGIIHTTLGLTGATGAAAADFKTNELKMLKDRTGITPTWAFGNTDTDALAYTNAGIDPKHCFYYKFTGDTKGGNVNDDYTKLVPTFDALPAHCP